MGEERNEGEKKRGFVVSFSGGSGGVFVPVTSQRGSARPLQLLPSVLFFYSKFGKVRVRKSLCCVEDERFLW
ncbi:hypothetical protein Lalb_Chr11g0068721 [Lupinus albus]|uniref:Uncharacterized protein n=1 Tax=Lupinus albus TaxID=3870 RepID=A0A6A4PSG1_LUPAL|nr:hypothetical protein Lalb_Chr11g0068721 [Lupinus albus]